MEKDLFDLLHRAYALAEPTSEVIGGRYAEDFAGTATWSRALDMDVPGRPDVRGLRYIDFKDCTNVHVLYSDGESKPMEDASLEDLEAIASAVDALRLEPSARHGREDWCEEVYLIRFADADRKGFPPDDPVYKASNMLSAWLDLDSMSVNPKEGCPLSAVMDELGYKGDRSGLVESSVVKDILVGGDTVSFRVEDNFSSFDVCRSLADRLGVDIDVTVKYRFSEFEGLDHESDEQHFTARCGRNLAKRLEDAIGMSVSHFGGPDGVAPFVSFSPFSSMSVESVGPEADRINLVRDGIHLTDGRDRVSVRIGEVRDPVQLERLLNMVNENFVRLAARAEGMREDAGEAVRFPTVDDARRERESILEELYGSSVAYQNVSAFMEGFDIVLDEGIDVPLTREAAIEAASHALTADGGEADLSEEVRKEIDEKGCTPEDALREWDVEVPRMPDQLVLYYDGDPMMRFFIPEDKGLWSACGVNDALVAFFQEDTHINLKHEFRLGQDYVGTEGRRVLDVCRRALTSPENRQKVAEATRKASRRARLREMDARLSAASLSGGRKLR